MRPETRARVRYLADNAGEVWPVPQKLEMGPDVPRQPDIVVIEEGDELARGSGETCVTRSPRSRASCVNNPSAECRRHLQCFVGRAVVGDDQFQS